MFEIFNMGIGLMLAVSPENVNCVKELLDEPVYEIGRSSRKKDAKVSSSNETKICGFCLW